jgi:hypothetical protein
MPFRSRLLYSQLTHSKLIHSLGNTVYAVVTDTGTTHVLLLEDGFVLLQEDGSSRIVLETAP